MSVALEILAKDTISVALLASSKRSLDIRRQSKMEYDDEANPINLFCSCEDCGAEIGKECNDCGSHDSRMQYFIANAPFKNRLRAMNWAYSELPGFVQRLIMEEEPLGSLYLNKTEFLIWKKFNLGGKINYTTLNRKVK
jgi:hypothetical protein